MRQRIFRIQSDRLLEIFSASLQAFRRPVELIMPALQKSLECRQLGSVVPELGELCRKLQLQGTGNGAGDFILYGENVRHLRIVALRPQMIAVAGVDELSAHAD